LPDSLSNKAWRIIEGQTPAQETHEIREDLTLGQILHMIIAIATIHSDPSYVEPILQIALDGLRAKADANSR
jgi:hypothetical protein